MDEPNVKVKSLAKALNVLNCFIQEPELGVTEISERLGLYKSNVCDILTTFQSLGYVDQSERTGKYHLGYRILELSHAFTTSMGFRKTIYPHMKQLADKVGETVYLGVPDGLDVLYLDAAYPGHEYMTRAMLGGSHVLHGNRQGHSQPAGRGHVGFAVFPEAQTLYQLDPDGSRKAASGPSGRPGAEIRGGQHGT